MAASYPTSVKSFSAKVNGDLIPATHVTDLEAEVVAIETALLGTLAGPLSLAEGRLTLTSGTPVTTGDVSAAATAYYTPYIGNGISLYDGSTAWAKYTFTEITISLVGLTASKPYDIFAYNSGGTVTIETLVWTNATTRATALAYQNGVLVKSGATTRRYLGTIYINSTGGQTDDTLAKRLVFNYTNRVLRPLYRTETTDSWTQGSSPITIRQANAAAANKIEVMVGYSDVPIWMRIEQLASNSVSAGSHAIGFGLDSTTSIDTGTGTLQACVPGLAWPAGQYGVLSSQFDGYTAVGYHYYSWNEVTYAGTTTALGDVGGPIVCMAGINGMTEA